MFDVSVNEAKIGCGGVHRKAMIAFDEVKLGPTAHRPLPVVLVQPLNIFTETVNGPPILANGFRMHAGIVIVINGKTL
jgi:hypothetical protein